MANRNLPPLLAMSDELDRLERKADADVRAELDEVRARLDGTLVRRVDLHESTVEAGERRDVLDDAV